MENKLTEFQQALMDAAEKWADECFFQGDAGAHKDCRDYPKYVAKSQEAKAKFCAWVERAVDCDEVQEYVGDLDKARKGMYEKKKYEIR